MERRFRPHDSTESRPHSQTACTQKGKMYENYTQNLIRLLAYRFAWSQTIFDITLEDDAVAFGETESFVNGLQRITVRCEGREYGRIHWTTIVVNNLECTLRVFGHSHTGSCKDAIGSCNFDAEILKLVGKYGCGKKLLTVFGNFNAERKSISDTNGFDFTSTSVQDADTWWWRFR